MILYKSKDLTVRELEKGDEALLVAWLSNPALLKFYEGRDRPHNLAMVREHFYNDEDVVRCIVEYQGEPVGYIQFYLLDQDELVEYGYAGLDQVIYGTDQFIGEIGMWNHGIGAKMVRSMIKYLAEEKKANRVVMDPHVKNGRAIACYEKCGLKKVKLLKAHELHEGELRDSWLMEYRCN